ncbi:hypothetical protein [Alkalinema sp. FACHB-956]|uniref:hypothetical protein n=1 Tax=Alkalinema sp. FACHB-956 TaxID=2692768 RepID=UPI001687480B|nr:hypothetical protein [Alkalinema sp. FACHB-956]MBD2327277.1 hypothetical protein [Alkalinema sp. FACHB-956]
MNVAGMNVAAGTVHDDGHRQANASQTQVYPEAKPRSVKPEDRSFRPLCPTGGESRVESLKAGLAITCWQ